MTRGLDAGRALSYAKIETLAWHVRSVLGLDSTSAVPGVTLFESLRKYTTATTRCRDYRLDYAVKELPAGIEAETRLEPGADRVVVVLSPRTYEDLERDVPRARFCLCHEIGHAACHCDLLLKLSGIPHGRAALMRGAARHADCHDTEWQANAFAAALLMPAAGLRRLESAGGSCSNHALQRTFGVSSVSADIRLRTWSTRRAELLKGVSDSLGHRR